MQVVALRDVKVPFEQIAQELHVGVGTVHADFRKAMQLWLTDNGIERLVAEECRSLDRLERVLWTKILVNNVSAADAVALAGAILKIKERRARFTGTDAPKVHEVRWVTVSEIEAEMEALEAQVAANPESAPAGHPG